MLKQLLKSFAKKFFNVRSNDERIRRLRSLGVKIGENCLIYSNKFSTEPYLVEMGDHVAVSRGTEFITHDSSAWIFREKNPDIDIFGRIKIGSNIFFGINCIILPNTVIGNNCIIGAGSVVRGTIPDNSIVTGNSLIEILKTDIMENMILKNKDALPTKRMKRKQKTEMIKEHFHIKD
jgi:acetyltransferase-like isoleucine patch superfamily enzyme